MEYNCQKKNENIKKRYFSLFIIAWLFRLSR